MADLLAATGIVLAGGRAARFGTDKLTAEVRGEPLLHLAVRAVAVVCQEVLILAPRHARAQDFPAVAGATLRVVHDPVAFPGPLVALLGAASAASHDRLLLVGGDMPELQDAVLRRLLGWGVGADGACLVAGGTDQPLPLGLSRPVVVREASVLVASGQRSLRALVAALELERVADTEWRALDPEARTLRDIDRPEDLHPAGGESAP